MASEGIGRTGATPLPQDYTVRAERLARIHFPRGLPLLKKSETSLLCDSFLIHPLLVTLRMSWRPAHPSLLWAVVISFLWPVAHPT